MLTILSSQYFVLIKLQCIYFSKNLFAWNDLSVSQVFREGKTAATQHLGFH